MSIKVENISKRYGAQLALNNVSFTINAGEIVGLLGPNGAGKSTMMKILTCFLPPSSGIAHIMGINIEEFPLRVKKLIGYLPENNPLYLDMYVKEYLNFIAEIHNIGRNKRGKITEIIELVGLTLEQHKKIGSLSKGYKQRVGLAQALIHNPEVLILDEPTSGLDPNQLIEIRGLIKDIGKEKTIILSTHIMQEVEAICDRAIIINKGIIVADSRTENLIENYNNRVTFVVEFNKYIEKDALKSIGKINKIDNIGNNTWQIENLNGVDLREDIFKFAVKNDLLVLSLQKQQSKLENIFRDLTK